MSTNIQAGAKYQREEETEADSSLRNPLPIRVSPYFVKMSSQNYKQVRSFMLYLKNVSFGNDFALYSTSLDLIRKYEGMSRAVKANAQVAFDEIQSDEKS